MRSTFKVLFYLKRSKTDNLKVIPVMGRITVNGSIAQFSCKLSVPESLWDVSANKAKGKSVEADRINSQLDNIRAQIAKHYQEICNRDSYVTAELVKNAYLGFGEKYKLLIETFVKFNEDFKKRVGVDRTYRAWQKYKKSIDHLTSFMQKEYKVSDMPLAQLELSFIEQYFVFLQNDLGLKPTTTSDYIKCLKYIVKIAFNNGWMPRNPFALYKYIAPNPERQFLSEEEIQKLRSIPLRHKCQDRTRDLFVFSCFTGICHADLRELTYDNLNQDAQGSWWISSERAKTGTKYLVKLLPVPLSIIEKYRGMARDNKLFVMSNVKVMDVSLRYITKHCGINKTITFHMARHTFATTISLMNGVPLETLSKMLGHKHITTTQIYAKVTEPMIEAAMTKLEDKLGDKFAV